VRENVEHLEELQARAEGAGLTTATVPLNRKTTVRCTAVERLDRHGARA